MRTLLLKTLYDKRWFALGWAAIIGGITLLVMTFYPTFSETNALSQISASVPEQFKRLVGDEASFRSVPSFIGTQLYEIRIPLLIMIMALVLAQSLSIGEEEKGLLRIMTTTPMSRSRILWERWCAGVIIIGLVNLATIIGTLIGAVIVGETAPLDLVLRLAVMSCLFGIVAFSIPYAVGVASGHRGLTMSIGLLITFGSFLLTTFAAAVEWLKPTEHLSLLHYYDTKTIVDGSFNTGDVMLLITIVTVSMLVATSFFRQRDIN